MFIDRWLQKGKMKGTGSMGREEFGQKLHSGGGKALKCCFYLLISAQIGEFVQGLYGKIVLR